MSVQLTRREVLGAGAASAAALYGLRPSQALHDALAAPPRCGHLSDIEHVVIFIQENRSFDHYFGTYRGVRGFDDTAGRRRLLPAGLPGRRATAATCCRSISTRTPTASAPTTSPTTGARSTAAGTAAAMDGFVREHLAAEGIENGPLTMGYYTRADLPFYHALADAFTLCDRYHCSVIGPTDPNRLYSLSARSIPTGARRARCWRRCRAPAPRPPARSPGRRCPSSSRRAGSAGRSMRSADNYSAVGDTPYPLFKQFTANPDAARRRAWRPAFPTTSWPTPRRGAAAGLVGLRPAGAERAPARAAHLGEYTTSLHPVGADLEPRPVGEDRAAS